MQTSQTAIWQCNTVCCASLAFQIELSKVHYIPICCAGGLQSCCNFNIDFFSSSEEYKFNPSLV